MQTTPDWNASDAARSVPRLPLGTRLALRFSSPGAALRRLEPAEGDPEGLARAHNLLDGLAERTGTRVPTLRVYAGATNALVAPGHRAVVALSDSALSELARTELEAVLAHCIVRLVYAHRTNPIGYDDDVRAVALTRYPPGLATALQKLVPRSGPGAHWFTAADAPSHRPVAERVAALEEL